MAEQAHKGAELHVKEGSRLSFDGALCTVRYIGDVQGTKGQWLGVEWDDPTRGKHSGEHQGVKYFKCSNRPVSQYSRLIISASFGHRLIDFHR